MTDLERLALVVANSHYLDPALRRLRAPAQDAEALAQVLKEPTIGNFSVETLIDKDRTVIEEALDTFFTDRKKADFLVLYFSCHGVKNSAGRLYFAASGTKLSLLPSTGVDSRYVKERVDESRAGKILLLLDCCYSGAFAQGFSSKAGMEVGDIETFKGSGRAVITASDSTEYSFEGTALTRDSGVASLFTGVLVKGLKTGEADVNGDGRVSVDDLYDYVFAQVREKNRNQTPRIFKNVKGELFLAASPRGAVRPPNSEQSVQEIMVGVLRSALNADQEGREVITLLHDDPKTGARSLARWLERTGKASTSLPLLVERLFMTPSWEDARQVLAENPQLMRDASPYLNTALALSSGDKTLGNRVELRYLFIRLAKEVGLESAWDFLTLAQEFEGGDGEDWLHSLANLCDAQYRYHLRLGDVRELAAAVAGWRNLLNDSSFAEADAGFRCSALASGGRAFLESYKSTGSLDELSEALHCFRHALDLCLESSESRPELLGLLAAGLIEHYHASGLLKDLEDAMAAYSEVVDMIGNDSPAWPFAVHGLGLALLDRFSYSGDPEDLDRALAALRAAFDAFPPDSDSALVAATGIAKALSTGNGMTSDIASLDEVIGLFNRAIERTPVNSPKRAAYLHSLGGVMLRRYGRSAERRDLDLGVDALREALASASGDAAYRPALLGALSQALIDRHSVTSDSADLDDAIALSRQAIAVARPGSPSTPDLMSQLSAGFLSRFDAVGNPSDLEAARDLLVHAVAETSAGAPALADRLSQLGELQTRRFEVSGRPEDLYQAMSALERAAAATPPESPGLAWTSFLLAKVMRLLVTVEGKHEALMSAVERYKISCALGLSDDLITCLRAGDEWGNWAASRVSWGEATEAYGLALTAAERLAITQVNDSDMLALLRELQDLPQRAAYAAAMAGDAEGAASLMERGLGLLQSDSVERRKGILDALMLGGRDDLVERYTRCAVLVDFLRRRRGRTTTLQWADDLRQASRELDDVISEIRATPGSETFAHVAGSIPWEMGANGDLDTLVYLVSSEPSGFAVFLRRGGAEIRWLPSLTLREVRERVKTFVGAQSGGVREHFIDVFDATAQWLWGTLVSPVLDLLEEVESAALIPSGALRVLPIHAAWTPDGISPSGRRYLSDLVNCTYLPYANVFQRSPAAWELPFDSAVYVGQPEPSDQPKLTYVRAESAAVSLVARDLLRLEGTHATRAAVSFALLGADLVHLACHTFTDVSHPLSGGGVSLANDELLTLGDLLRLRLNAQLFVLSNSSPLLIDAISPEVIGLPSGLLRSGASGVVGSLWLVEDLSAALLMIRFYSELLDELTPVSALINAQRWLRDSTNASKLEDVEGLVGTVAPRGDVDVLVDALARMDPAERSFSHPIFWSAFAYFGA